ncbi:MAG: hypothetical protein IPG66_18845 [Hydrogenophilales bacterium]|nr:hypothetical protein [Hydrogenophilales bacterium]
MIRNFSLIALAAVTLAGCLSISSSDPILSNNDPSGYCSGKELQCREICGSVGVQSFACNARPGQEISYKCECRKSGSAP